MDKLNEVENVLSKYHHEYLLKYCDLVNNKNKLLDEILNVDFDLQEKLYSEAKKENTNIKTNLENVDAIDKSSFSEEELGEYFTIGYKEIKDGKLGIVTLAGGQGTRLGHTGPKGTYELLSDLSLFEILFEILLEINFS